MKNRRMFPLYVDLSKIPVLVAGGGSVAERRVKTLLPFVEHIKVVSPYVSPALRCFAEDEKIIWKEKCYEEGDLEGAGIVLAATDQEEINYRIYSDCKNRGITVNISNDKEKCDFYFPGIINYEGIVIGFNGGGVNHRKTREVREQVQKFLKEEK